MGFSVLWSLVSIVALGTFAQWIAWRLKVPAILVLLGAGLLAGPAFGFLQPDALFGQLLLPFVSLCVAIVLFEGGLGLKFRDIRPIGGALISLLVVGGAVTWVGIAVAAHTFLDVGWRVAWLLGAILVVTGPTVVIPLLQHVRLTGQVGALLRWEGIVIDPIGAVLAALVFEVVREDIHSTPGEIVIGLLGTAATGTIAGLVGAAIVTVAIGRYWLPDRLHSPATLATVVTAFAAGNLFYSEGGLISVTVMGIVLANQKYAQIKHVLHFKEALTALLVSSLFVVLGARVSPEEVVALDSGGLLFLGALIFLVRPAAAFLSTIGTQLNWRQRVFVAGLAPRGIVAAAVSSVFALGLHGSTLHGAEVLVPATILIIIGTVTFYGLWSPIAARILGLVPSNPQGVLIAGAHVWAREIAAALQAHKIDVVLVDTDMSKVHAARSRGIPATCGSILSDEVANEIDFSNLIKLLALTPNQELNALACHQYAEVFGREQVYHMAVSSEGGRMESVSKEQKSRVLFRADLTHQELSTRLGQHPVIKSTSVADANGLKTFLADNGDAIVPIALVRKDGTLSFIVAGGNLTGKTGDTLLYFELAAE